MKDFFTYEQQLQQLKDRGLQIKDESYAMTCLKEEGYYNLINGYAKIFECKRGYVQGTTFDHIVALYIFDRNLRSILYKYTSIIECRIKAFIAHEFSRKHGVEEQKYLTPGNFTSQLNQQAAVQKLITCCQEVIRDGQDVSSNRCRVYIKHNIEKHGHVPFWVLVRALSFGTISIFYELMLMDEKETIANEYNLTATELANILEVIVQFRNIVAHGERTFCAYLPKVRLSQKLGIFNNLSIAKTPTGQIKHGRRDILALLICCKYLLSNIEFAGLAEEIDSALEDLKKLISPTAMGQVKTLMGLNSVRLEALNRVSK